MFNTYKQIAQAYTDGQAFKAGILAWTQRILIFVASAMMSFSVFLYSIQNWQLEFERVILAIVSFLLPFLIAVCVEAAVISSAGAIRANIKNGLAWATLVLATFASSTGGEVFFHTLSDVAKLPEPIQIMFALFGLFVPIFQVMFELNQDNIQAFIKEGVDSSEVTNHILEKQTEHDIVKVRFDKRHESMSKELVASKIEEHSDRYVIEKVTEGQTTIIEVESEECLTESAVIELIESKLSAITYQIQPPIIDIDSVIERVIVSLNDSNLIVDSKFESNLIAKSDNESKLTVDSKVKADSESKLSTESDSVEVPNNVDSKSLTGKSAVVNFLDSESDNQKYYWAEHKDELAEKFSTSWQTVNRAFNSHFPQYRKRS